MRTILPVLGIVALTTVGCGTATISFSVLTPAPITIPQDIQTIVVIDRAMPEDTDMNRLESILTLEGPRLNRAARQNVMEGLRMSLTNSTRYNVIVSNDVFIGSSNGNILPEPLPWNLVDELAQRHNADVLICLEAFDADFIVAAVKLGSLLSTESEAAGVATVNAGFRMYWPSKRFIADEYKFKHVADWNTGGHAIVTAINTMRIRQDAISNASREAGLVYGERITPAWYRVSREYYKRGGSNTSLAAGARMMELNDWDKAVFTLTKATETGNTKSRGKAAHNLAIVNEILGDLTAAKEWTTVAWGMYKVRKSKEYGYILTNRIQEQESLNAQLQKTK